MRSTRASVSLAAAAVAVAIGLAGCVGAVGFPPQPADGTVAGLLGAPTR